MTEDNNKNIEYVVRHYDRPIMSDGRVNTHTTPVASDITGMTPRYSTYSEAQQVADSNNANSTPYAGHKSEYFVAQVKKE
jgi:hypothetical protein